MEIKFFKIKKSFKKGGLHIDPNIYWNVVLCIGLIVVLVSFVFGFYLFMEINKELISPSNIGASQVKTISKERIGKVLLYFSEKENKSIDILNSPSPLVDPSL